jgi:hypothetical protein
MNTISVGTNHFIDETAALRYYLPYYGGSYRDARFAVETKIREGEIVIGQPQVGVDEILLVNQQEGRYFIERPL